MHLVQSIKVNSSTVKLMEAESKYGKLDLKTEMSDTTMEIGSMIG